MDLNEARLIGNVAKFNIKEVAGKKVLEISLATNHPYKKGEEWQNETTFHNIVSWNTADKIGAKLQKGTKMFVAGRIKVDTWEGQNGKQYKTVIVADKIILLNKLAEVPETAQDDEASF